MPFDSADAARAAEIKAALIKALAPFAANTPNWVAVVALCTTARDLITRCKPENRSDLEQLAATFVSGDVPDDQKMIITPDRLM